MSRTKTVNGKRVLLATRVPEPVFNAVKTALGDRDQSEWVRNAVLAALAAQGITVETIPEPAPVKTKRAPSRVQPDGLLPQRRKTPPKTNRPLGAGVFREPGGAEVTTSIPPVPAVERTRCDHPGIRSVGSAMGTCPGCKHRVESGGLWAPECDAGTCGHKQG